MPVPAVHRCAWAPEIAVLRALRPMSASRRSRTAGASSPVERDRRRLKARQIELPRWPHADRSGERHGRSHRPGRERISPKLRRMRLHRVADACAEEGSRRRGTRATTRIRQCQEERT